MPGNNFNFTTLLRTRSVRLVHVEEHIGKQADCFHFQLVIIVAEQT